MEQYKISNEDGNCIVKLDKNNNWKLVIQTYGLAYNERKQLLEYVIKNQL